MRYTNEDNAFQVSVRRAGLNEDDGRSWKPLHKNCGDIPGVPKDFLHTAEILNLKRNALGIHF